MAPSPATPIPVLPGLVAPERLRTEYLEDPLGLDETHPRLSWTLTSPRRGAAQTAYQVQAASSPDVLKSGMGDLWDSGKVMSAESAQVREGAGAVGHAEGVSSVRIESGRTEVEIGSGDYLFSVPAQALAQ